MGDEMDRDDHILDALLALGWDVKVDASGNITAERNQSVIMGKIEDGGGVAWPAADISGVLREARIKDFQQRIEKHKSSHSATGPGPKLF
jgi:hypothetical protein